MARIAQLSFLILAGSLIAQPSWARDKVPDFVGQWTINNELTDAIAPEFKDSDLFSGFGNGSVSVSVMGIPLPGGGQRQASSGGALKDPDVLSCREMRIEQHGDGLQMTYEGVGSELLRPGDYRGRQSSWSRKRISQRYKSTSRKVSKKWEVRRDGRLLVTVVINPKNDKKRTYKRVFDPVPEDAES